jgi:hypothetical protein
MQTVDEMMEEAFLSERDSLSITRAHGIFLVSRIEARELPAIPYAMGTAKADAYLVGREEGRIIWRTIWLA